MNYIKRNYYIEKISPFIGKDIIKIIIGQRRVGKSYFLYQLQDVISEKYSDCNIIYINKELYKFDNIRDFRDLIKYVKGEAEENKTNYLFIDEVQEITEYEKALRSLLAEGGFDIYCTGSNASMFSSELATYLSGRYVEIKIFSLSYLEFLRFHNSENTKESFIKYIKYGGLPYLYNLELSDEIVYEYLRNIYNTILLKDIVSRHNIRNVNLLEKLVKYLASNCGSIISAKRISDFLQSQRIKMSVKVIINYLDYLRDAFFIFKVSREEVVGKKIFEIGEKFYFEDLGIKHSIKSYNQTEIGNVLENLVFNHMKFNGYDITVGKLGSKEIDFICKKGSKKLYIQVCYLLPDKRVLDREFGNLLSIQDNYPKIVVSMDESIGDSYKGIHHVHIREFICTNYT